MKNALALIGALVIPTIARADHDFTYKSVCLWNATGETLTGQMEWDELDPASFKLQPMGYFTYSWQQMAGTTRTPPLRLWSQEAPGAVLDTSIDKGLLLQPLDTGLERNCTKLRRLKLHYRIEEVYDPNGNVTAFKVVGPMSNP